MCGRYVTGTDEHDWRAWASLLELSTDVLTHAFARAPPPNEAEGLLGQAFYPTASVPIVRRAQGRAVVESVRWGLVPSWMKRPMSRAPLFNVRFETAPQRFKKYLASRRCLLPATGFWLPKDAGSKSGGAAPFVRVAGAPTFAFAGLWTEREIEGETLRSCTILTIEAKPPLRALHERMPIVLTLETAGPWLEDSTPVEELAQLCSNADVEFELVPDAA